mgnify:FL=1
MNKKRFAPKKTPKPKIFRFTGLDSKKYSLTLQQKLFAEYYCDRSMNGVTAVIEAGYNVMGKGIINRNLAHSIASENLKKPAICAYINVLFHSIGLTEQVVDIELAYLVRQKADLGAKIRAIDIYYKKKGLYAPEKLQHSIDTRLEEFLDKVSKDLP